MSQPLAPQPWAGSAATAYLVGAGPGDPGLLTLRGAECLARADLLLYDYLANPRLLELAPPQAERICLGRHGAGRLMPPAEVHARMVEAALAGRTVVRLKSGDPLVFARAAEELEALAAAGVPVEIVPGISAAFAAASYAGIPLTRRDGASAIALVTGQEQCDKPNSSLDYAALARFPGTLVFYMGATTAERWTRALIDQGRAADTPAAIVRRCSWPDQVTVRTTLGKVAAEIAERKLRPPMIVVVGEAAAESLACEWFTARPLFGKKVLVTRAAEQALPLVRRLEELGAAVWLQPAIEIGPPDDWSPVDAALARIASFDWLVFSSANGVRALCERLWHVGGDARRLAHLRLAAIGPATAEALARHGLRADLVPAEFRAESLAASLAPVAGGQRVLLVRASRGRDLLAQELAAAGAAVEQVVVYSSRDVAAPEPEVAALLAAGKIDYVTATSSAIARSLARLFGQDLQQTRLVSISPLTSQVLQEAGFPPAIEARTYTMEGLVAALLAALD